MSKITIIHERIVKLLTEDTYVHVEYSVREIQQYLNFHHDDMWVTERNIYQAVKLLPKYCVLRELGRLVIRPRYFAPSEEVYALFLEIIGDMYGIPHFVESREQEIREKLVLHKSAVHQTLQWAAVGNFEYRPYTYGMAVTIRGALPC